MLLLRKLIMNRVLIAPSIFAGDFFNISKSIERCEMLNVDAIHYDIMDNHFVPNISFGPKILSDIITKTSIPGYVHLMIELDKNPEKTLKPFLNLPIDHFIIHVENNPEVIDNYLNYLNKKKKGIGLSLKPSTPIEVIKNYLDKINLILIMSVEPGFSGQKFLNSSLKKIEKAKEIVEGKNIKIQVDGGINRKNYKSIIRAGADFLVIGSAFFSTENEDWIKKIREST